MNLTLSQLQVLRTWGLALQAANNTLSEFHLTAMANALATPDYWVWKSNVTRSEMYHSTSPSGSTWNWATYKAQSVPEQNSWTQMFMGDSGPIGQVNFRSGIASIFTGSAAQNTQRDHCLAIGRRRATVAEKLLAIAVTSPPANTGNNSSDARGSVTNPDNLGAEGEVTVQNIVDAIS